MIYCKKIENNTSNSNSNYIPVTYFTTKLNSNKIYVGNSTNITVNINPSNATNKEISWTSSDNKIATIENGIVKGLKNGTVTITAKSGKASATCIVKVTGGPVKLTEISLEDGEQAITLRKEVVVSSAPQVVAAPVQAAAPVDSFVVPEPWPMPGYHSDVIMAAGAFVQGSSIELSADAPIEPPYAVYFQGGLTWYHAKLGIMMSVQKLFEEGLIQL